MRIDNLREVTTLLELLLEQIRSGIVLASNVNVDIGDVTLNNGSGAAAVNIQDGGNTITVDGGITPTDDFTNPTTSIASTGLNMVYDGSKWDMARGDSTNGTLVNLGSNNDVTVTGTVTANISGSISNTEFASDITKIGGIANPTRGAVKTIPVEIVDASGVQITSFGSATTNITQVGTTTIPTKGSTPVIPTIIVDGSGNQITTFGSATSNVTQLGSQNIDLGSGTIGVGTQRIVHATDDKVVTLLQSEPVLLIGNYSSPEDGTVVYTSSASLTCSLFPFVVDSVNCNILGVYVTNASGVVTKYINGHNGISLSATANVVSIIGATPFLNTDTKYRLVLHYQAKAYDATTDTTKVSVQAADWGSKNTDAVPIIASAQTLTTSFADLGSGFEIPCSGYKTLGVWIKLTIQQSVGVQLQALAKHTSAGTEEYNHPIETVSSTLVSITPEIVQFPDANGLYLLKINLDNVVPYIQLQVKMTTDSGTDGTIDTAYYTLGY